MKLEVVKDYNCWGQNETTVNLFIRNFCYAGTIPTDVYYELNNAVESKDYKKIFGIIKRLRMGRERR